MWSTSCEWHICATAAPLKGIESMEALKKHTEVQVDISQMKCKSFITQEVQVVYDDNMFTTVSDFEKFTVTPSGTYRTALEKALKEYNFWYSELRNIERFYIVPVHLTGIPREATLWLAIDHLERNLNRINTALTDSSKYIAWVVEGSVEELNINAGEPLQTFSILQSISIANDLLSFVKTISARIQTDMFPSYHENTKEMQNIVTKVAQAKQPPVINCLIPMPFLIDLELSSLYEPASNVLFSDVYGPIMLYYKLINMIMTLSAHLHHISPRKKDDRTCVALTGEKDLKRVQMEAELCYRIPVQCQEFSRCIHAKDNLLRSLPYLTRCAVDSRYPHLRQMVLKGPYDLNTHTFNNPKLTVT
jgi:hypothetical protein